MDTATRTPPKKQKGHKTGPRTINGAALDVHCGSLFLGWSEKKTRGLIERRLIPFRWQCGRIIFIRSELEEWLRTLDGCTLDQAKANQEARHG
jgi:hypothetical protein